MPDYRKVVTEEVPEDTTLILKVWRALRLEPPPREGPCWCNGPYSQEKDHHSWCRANRQTWRKALRLLSTLRSAD